MTGAGVERAAEIGRAFDHVGQFGAIDETDLAVAVVPLQLFRIGAAEPPRIYRRVKLSKAEPCGQEEIPRNTRPGSGNAASVLFADSGLGMTVTTQTTRRLRRSLAAHPMRYAPSAFKRPETPMSATV